MCYSTEGRNKESLRLFIKRAHINDPKELGVCAHGSPGDVRHDDEQFVYHTNIDYEFVFNIVLLLMPCSHCLCPTMKYNE